MKNTLNIYNFFYSEGCFFTKKNNFIFMENLEMLDNVLSWKLVWDRDTKDVLFLNQVGKIETENEIFETKNQNEIYEKITELGLKYNPSILDNEEWI